MAADQRQGQDDAWTAARPSQGRDNAGTAARPSREREDAGRTARPSRERDDAGKKSVRRSRVRRVQHLATVATAVIVALGLIGLGLWLLFDTRPEVTVRTYPVEYEALIRIRATDNGIDPAWVASIILAESDYQPEAVSSANAQGLMQLLPDTARWIAGKFDETYEEGCLFDPETNVRYGCWYLGWLYGRFDGDMTCATAAYHAGQGQVDAWLADPACSDDGKTLSRIPFETTDTYVKRVL